MTTNIAIKANTIRLLCTLIIITDRIRLPVPRSSSVFLNCNENNNLLGLINIDYRLLM